MLIMAIDDVRDALHKGHPEPTDLAVTTGFRIQDFRPMVDVCAGGRRGGGDSFCNCRRIGPESGACQSGEKPQNGIISVQSYSDTV